MPLFVWFIVSQCLFFPSSDSDTLIAIFSVHILMTRYIVPFVVGLWNLKLYAIAWTVNCPYNFPGQNASTLQKKKWSRKNSWSSFSGPVSGFYDGFYDHQLLTGAVLRGAGRRINTRFFVTFSCFQAHIWIVKICLWEWTSTRSHEPMPGIVLANEVEPRDHLVESLLG